MLRAFRPAALILTFVVATLLVVRECQAWGAQGHRIIGQIAWHYLTPEAKAAITDLLGQQSLGEAGTWADLRFRRLIPGRPLYPGTLMTAL